MASVSATSEFEGWAVMTRLQAIQERVRRHEYDLTEPSDAAWGLYCCDQLLWLLARVEQMSVTINDLGGLLLCVKRTGNTPEFMEYLKERVEAAEAVLKAVHEEVPETVQS
jgi:hypothetical protein